MNMRHLVPTSLAVTAALVLGALAACTEDPATTAQDGGAKDAAVPKSDAVAANDATPTTDSAVSDASTSDSASDSASPSDAAGEAATIGPVALVYAGRFNGIDQRIATATLGSDGRVVGYSAFVNEAPQVLSATVDGIFNDSFAVSSRWINGTVTGPMYDDGGVKTLLANEGQHLGIAKVAGDLPASGTVAYTVAAATKPTLRGGVVGEGTVTGSLTAHFGGNAGTRIGFTLMVTMPDGTFEVLANGGSAQVGDAGGTGTMGDASFRFANPSLAVSTDAGACAPDAGACPTTGGTRAVFSGPNAERIVIAYAFGNRTGVVVFKKE